MTFIKTHWTLSRSLGRAGRCLLLAMGLSVLGACDDIFEVENPGSLVDEDLEVPFLEATLSTTAEGSLVGPFSSALVNGEMLGDHVWHPSVQDFALLIDAGYRDRDISAAEGLFNGLMSSIWVSDNMVERLTAMVANPSAHAGVANSYFMGALGRMTAAAYYEAVVYDGGPALPPAQAIADARDRFLSAADIAAAAGESNLQAAALGGAARAMRSVYYEAEIAGSGSLADMAQAETYALQALAIDDDYRLNLRYGQPGTSNGHFTGLTEGPYHRMHESYAFRLDPVTGEVDPRIVFNPTPETPGPRGETRYLQMKFPDRSTPLPASRAAEAELIVAEARFLDDDPQGAVDYINLVRARSGLDPFSSTDEAEIWDQLLYERDTELWLEGRRWEDHRYYEIIPLAWIQRNIDIGTEPRWPMSVQERFNNPNIAGGGG